MTWGSRVSLPSNLPLISSDLAGSNMGRYACRWLIVTFSLLRCRLQQRQLNYLMAGWVLDWQNCQAHEFGYGHCIQEEFIDTCASIALNKRGEGSVLEGLRWCPQASLHSFSDRHIVLWGLVKVCSKNT